MAKQKSKIESLLEQGYNQQIYPTYEAAKTFKEAFEKKGRSVHYIRSGSKGNYQHNLLEK